MECAEGLEIPETLQDKVTMSAFEGTPLDVVLHDCGVAAVAVVSGGPSRGGRRARPHGATR